MTPLLNIHRQIIIQAPVMFDSDPTAKPRFGGKKLLKKDLQAECRKRNPAAHNRLRSENNNQLHKPSGRYCTSWSIMILFDVKLKRSPASSFQAFSGIIDGKLKMERHLQGTALSKAILDRTETENKFRLLPLKS